MVGAVCLLGGQGLLGDGAIWMFRLAMAVVTLTNGEAVLITWVLDRWHTDVSSLRMARHLSRNG